MSSGAFHPSRPAGAIRQGSAGIIAHGNTTAEGGAGISEQVAELADMLNSHAYQRIPAQNRAL